MGLGPFSRSLSSYEKTSVQSTATSFPNPDPKNFRIEKHVEIGKFVVLRIKYPDCTNYEGSKILVYQNTTIPKLLAQKSLDPHFCDNENFFSPIARFVPTEEGWTMACRFCEAIMSHCNICNSSYGRKHSCVGNTEPIRPDEVVKNKRGVIPDIVFEVFNEMIVQKWDGGCSTIGQGDLVKEMVRRGLDRNDIFEKGWLNVEEVYQKAGWEVVYNKPAFNENYQAEFVFRNAALV